MANDDGERRVMHLRTVCGKGGGPEKTLLCTARYMQAPYVVELAYIRPADDPAYDMPARAAEMEVPLVDIPEAGFWDVRSIYRLAGEIRRFRPHIVHAHDYKTNLLAVLLRRWFGFKAVTTMHGYVGLSPRLALYYKLDRWALRHLDRVVVVSPDLGNVAERAGVSPHRIAQIDNAIDTDCYRRLQSVESAKKRHELDERRICIGAVGRLEAEKGFENLITAVRDLTAQGAELQCLLIGEGSLRPRLKEMVDAFGLQGVVKLLGHRRDAADFYQAMDVFVLSSLREGLPNVVLEAMACEVPVVATRIAGIPRLIRDGENGLLVSPGNVGELRRGIHRLVEDVALRRRLAAAGRKTVEERFSFTERLRKITAVYDRLLREEPLPFDSAATHARQNERLVRNGDGHPPLAAGVPSARRHAAGQSRD